MVRGLIENKTPIHTTSSNYKVNELAMSLVFLKSRIIKAGGEGKDLLPITIFSHPQDFDYQIVFQ